MKKLLAATLLAAPLLAACLTAAVPANATTLLKLTDAPVQSQTPFALSIVADGPTTLLVVGGYQLPSFIQLTEVSVTQTGSSGNLLKSGWQFAGAPIGSWSDQYDDSPHGTGTNAVEFGSIKVNSYDLYYQTFASTPGEIYSFKFLYTQDYDGPNGFKAIVNQPIDQIMADSVPEPSGWAMMILGFALFGFAQRRRISAAVSGA